jgi:hypothetical protein
MLSTVSSPRGRSSFEEKSSTTCSCQCYIDSLRQITHLLAHSFHTSYALCFLKRVNFHRRSVHNCFELFVDVIQNLVVHFECLEDLLVRVLEGQAGKIQSDLAPACVRAAPVRRPQEDDELRPIADYIGPANGLPQRVSSVAVVLCTTRRSLHLSG